MADEQETETPETQEPAAPEAAVEEAAASAAPAAEAPAAEAPATQAPAPSAPPAEPEEQLAPKERRRRARSTHTGTARTPRSPEERHGERVETRRRKAAQRRARRLQEREKRSAARAGGAAAAPAPAAAEREPGTRKVRQGIVVSDKADKTITVRIDVARRHRRYEKIVRSSSTLHAHDEGNEAHEGDTVRVVESRPLSRTKRWKLVDVVERAR
jgi:small subunit ribosomal protein S17